jgi:Tol biopolymer transport system component
VKSRARLPWVAAIVAAVVAGSGGTLLFRPRPAEAPEMRLQIVTPDATAHFALSPDGRSLVFAASGQLWLRPLDDETARPLTGTDGGDRPFWSPDSRSIGFFGDGKLKRLDVAGGSVRTVADFPNPTLVGATWNPDDVILVGGNPGPIERVPASGGTREAVTSLGADQFSHRHPEFLPDGQHFLFFVTGSPAVRGLYVGSLDSKDSRRLFQADAAGVFVPPDSSLFVLQETLFAQRLDLQRLEPIGEPFLVTEQVAYTRPSADTRADVSSSSNGLLAYRASPTQSRLLTWLDRAGGQVATVGGPDATAAPYTAGSVRLSPDARYAALMRRVGGNTDIHLVELARNVPNRFTDDPAGDGNPAWSPDGRRIVFTSARSGHNELYVRSVVGDSLEGLLLEPSANSNRQALDWSRDGQLILYNNIGDTTDWDLWVARDAEDRRPVPVVRTPSNESTGRFSPDSQWIAYQSDAAGRNEIFVKRLLGTGGDVQVSIGGGTNPLWPSDREILYTAPNNRVMAVAVTLPAEGTNVQPGIPVPLFTLPAGSSYDVTADSQRFLANVPTDEALVSPITVVLNWRRAGN